MYQDQAAAEVLANALTSAGNKVLVHAGKDAACNCGGYNQQGYYPGAKPGYFYPPPPLNGSGLMPKALPNLTHPLPDLLHLSHHHNHSGHDPLAFYSGGGYYYPGWYYPGKAGCKIDTQHHENISAGLWALVARNP